MAESSPPGKGTGTATPHLFTAAAHSHLVAYLAALHGSCITHDHMTGSFLPPLNHEKLLAWWKEKMSEAAAGTRVIVLLLDESQPGTKAKGTELVGVAMLTFSQCETSPFRASLESLLVGQKYRRRGGARALVRALHLEAGVRGRFLVTAEAEAGSPGETVLKKFGYIEAGRVPGYAISPADPSTRVDEVILYKQLGETS